jgi:hypothetical protein
VRHDVAKRTVIGQCPAHALLRRISRIGCKAAEQKARG